MDKNSAGTLAVVLGAAAFPKYSDLKGGEAFAASAHAVVDCLASQFGTDWKQGHLLNLFNSEDLPRVQLNSLREFCTSNAESQRILIYYVGHGGFFGGQNYFLALNATEKGDEFFTGLEIRNLALVLDQCFPGKQVVLILDCCFAAEAMVQFQDAGAVGRAVETQTFNAFPSSGTSLLCASSKDDMSVWQSTGERTMFSECFTEVLNSGISGKNERLSLREIGEAVEALIRARFGHKGVRPEVHSPRQRGADVAREPLFRNVAYRPPEPKRLPAEITAALRNPIPQVRIGGVAALSHLAEAADREVLKLIQGELGEMAERDDSFSVREAAKLALNKMVQSATSNEHSGERRETREEEGGTQRAAQGRTAKDHSASKSKEAQRKEVEAQTELKAKQEQQKRAEAKARRDAEKQRKEVEARAELKAKQEQQKRAKAKARRDAEKQRKEVEAQAKRKVKKIATAPSGASKEGPAAKVATSMTSAKSYSGGVTSAIGSEGVENELPPPRVKEQSEPPSIEQAPNPLTDRKGPKETLAIAIVIAVAILSSIIWMIVTANMN